MGGHALGGEDALRKFTLSILRAGGRGEELRDRDDQIGRAHV